MDPLVNFVRNSRITEAVILTSFHQSPLPWLCCCGWPAWSASPGPPPTMRARCWMSGSGPARTFPRTSRRPCGLWASPGLRASSSRRATTESSWSRTPQIRHLVGDGPYVVVHPGATVPARAWPPLHHAAAVELLEGAGHRVVVTGGPGETALTATVAGPSAIDLGGRTDLSTLSGCPGQRGRCGHRKHRPRTPGRRRRNARGEPVLPCCSGRPLGTVRRPAGTAGRPERAVQAEPRTHLSGTGTSLPGSVSPEQVVEAVERLLSGVSSLSTRRKVRHQ